MVGMSESLPDFSWHDTELCNQKSNVSAGASHDSSVVPRKNRSLADPSSLMSLQSDQPCRGVCDKASVELRSQLLDQHPDVKRLVTKIVEIVQSVQNDE